MLRKRLKQLGAWMLTVCLAFGAVQFPAMEVKAAEGENLARSATATASNVEADTSFTADKVIDGDKTSSNSRWGTDVTSASRTSFWLQLAWQEAKTLKSFSITWQRRTVRNLVIQTSDTGADDSWTDVWSRTTNSSSLTEEITLDTAVTTKYVRFFMTDILAHAPDDNEGFSWANVSVFEIEAYADEIPDDRSEAQKIADDITAPTVTGNDTQIPMPNVAEGVTVRFCADYEQVISEEGTIYTPLETKIVKGFYEVTCPSSEEEEEGSTAKSVEFSITVPGEYTDGEGANAKPVVIPELQEWHGTSGDFMVGSASRIVVGSNALADVADKFAEDYKEITGLDIQVISGTKDIASAGDFYLELTTEKKGLDKEGYTINIEDVVSVEAEQSTGAYWSTRTILQILKLTNGSIPKGMVRDYPKYEVRAFSLDVGRKPFTLDALYDFAENMAWYKMNSFQVHLSDNLIFHEDYPTLEEAVEKSYAGFRLESGVQNPQQNNQTATSEDVYYTKDEFRTFIQDSRLIGVDIVPEFDMPAHALPFTRAFQQYMTKRAGGSHSYLIEEIDIANPEARAWARDIWNDYFEGDNPVFDEEMTVHIGTDEYHGTDGQEGKELFRQFSDEMIEFVQESGRTVRMWGSLSNKSGTTPVRSEGVQLNIWNTGYANPQDMYNLGFGLINTLEGPNYIVPAAGYYNDYIAASNIYNSWQPNVMGNLTASAGDDQMLGACYAIWHDSVDTRANGISQYDSFDRFFKPLPAYGAKLWGEAEDYVDGSQRGYEAFRQDADKIGTAPGTTIYGEVKHKTSTIADYTFDETLTKDSSENANHLTDKNNIKLVTTDEDKMALRLMGEESYVETPLNMVGSNAILTMKVKMDADAEGEQILCESKDVFGTNGTYSFKASQKNTGKVGFSREGYDYSFNYMLPKNEWVTLEFHSGKDSVELYVDGELIDNKHYNSNGELATTQKGSETVAISKNNNPDIYYFNHPETELSEKLTKEGITKIATMMVPFGRIGSKTNSFKGQIEFATVATEKKQVEIQDGSDKVAQDNMSAAACSEASEGPASFAIDGQDSTYWHSNWSNDTVIEGEHHWFEVTLSDPTEICKLSYLPRQDSGNGRIFEYSIEVTKEDGTIETVVDHAVWEDNAERKIAVFEPITAKKVKLKIHNAAGDRNGIHATIAEFNLYKVFTYTKEDLAQALAVYENYKSVQYTELSWNAFSNVYESAKQMTESSEYTPEEYYSAYEQVKKAAAELIERSTERRLQDAIKGAEQIKVEDYAANGYTLYQTAVNDAKALDVSATEAQKLSAAEAIERAKENLANISVLKEAVLGAPDDRYLEGCTTGSKTAYDTALTAVNAAIANAALTKEGANQVLNDFKAALRGLVDLSQLKAAVAALDDIDSSGYTEDSIVVLSAALKAAEAILAKADATQTEVDKAFAALSSAAEALVPKDPVSIKKGELQEKVDEEETKLTSQEYTDESIEKLQKAIDAAKAILADENATIEEVEAALEALNGVNLVTKVEAKKAELTQALEAAEQQLSNPDAYEASYIEALQEAVNTATELLTKADVTLEELEAALSDLQDKMEVNPGEDPGDEERAEINSITKEFEEQLKNESEYTLESVEAVRAAIDAAKEVLDNPKATLDELTEALQALQEVKLVTKVEAKKAELSQILEIAEQQLSNPDAYEASYIEALQEAVDAVKTLLNQDNVTLEELEAALENLNSKIEMSDEDVKRIEITQKIEELEKQLPEDTSEYTEESVKAYKEAIEKAKILLGNPQATLDELTEAMEALSTIKLVTKLEAKKSELQAAINTAKAQITDESKYTSASVNQLKEAITSAEELLKQEDILLEKVEEALGKLKNIKLVPQAKPAVYTVTFISNRGTAVASQKVEHGKTARRPAPPKRTGYTFVNWYRDSRLTQVYNFNSPVTSNITLYAKWNPIPPAKKTVPDTTRTEVYGDVLYKVTVSHAANGTVTAFKLNNKKASKIIIPSVIEIDGYQFKVTEISATAFQKASRLKSIVIGENVTKIGSKAFNGCKKLNNIRFTSASAPKIGSKAFKGTAAKKCKVFISKKIKKKTFNKMKKQLKKAGISKKASFKQK